MLQTSTVGIKHDATVLERQLESTRKQLQTQKEESARTEAQLRSEVASAQGKHSQEVQMLVAKLEESVGTYNNSVAEAERMMRAKEELLRKYKQEARMASSKLQSYQVTCSS
jgi:chromosome segregation ATPase